MTPCSTERSTDHLQNQNNRSTSSTNTTSAESDSATIFSDISSDDCTATSTTSPDPDYSYWGPLLSISEGALAKLVKRLVGGRFGFQCWGYARTEGSFNVVYIMKFMSGEKVVVKIPACGRGRRWSADAAAEMRSQALTMKHIRHKCKIPIPEVLAFDETFNNEIGAPFILMTYIEGKPIYKAWWDESGLVPLEAKREKILRSIARAMSELRHVEFGAIGMPEYHDNEGLAPKVVRNLVLRSDNAAIAGERWERLPTYKNSKKYLRTLIDDEWQNLLSEETDMNQHEGRYKVLELILECIPRSTLTSNGVETFGISHPDLDVQNILIDDDGNVTGILDWDGVRAKPHFMAWPSFPIWLRQDWRDDYIHPFGDAFHTASELERYRQIYVDEFRTASRSDTAANFCAASHVLSGLYMCMMGVDGFYSWIDKVVREIMPRVDTYTFYWYLNDDGWVECGGRDLRCFMRERIQELLHSKSMVQNGGHKNGRSHGKALLAKIQAEEAGRPANNSTRNETAIEERKVMLQPPNFAPKPNATTADTSSTSSQNVLSNESSNAEVSTPPTSATSDSNNSKSSKFKAAFRAMTNKKTWKNIALGALGVHNHGHGIAFLRY